ncbi:Cytochrome b561 like protein [Citrobacter portucalensis]|nr:Cytochrome b561 like protein [Citrobacter portucalensis]
MVIKKNSGFGGSQFADICYFLIAAHAGAALFHHYIQKDNTLLRVMPEHNHLNN